jgi:hypothetical protein
MYTHAYSFVQTLCEGTARSTKILSKTLSEWLAHLKQGDEILAIHKRRQKHPYIVISYKGPFDQCLEQFLEGSDEDVDEVGDEVSNDVEEWIDVNGKMVSTHPASWFIVGYHTLLREAGCPHVDNIEKYLVENLGIFSHYYFSVCMFTSMEQTSQNKHLIYYVFCFQIHGIWGSDCAWSMRSL